MEKTRESITRAMTWPAMLVFGMMAYLFAPLLLESQRTAEYWMRVVSVEATTTAAGDSPVLTVERQIVRPFVADWTVVVRKQVGVGWIISCTAHGGGNYRVDAALPEPLTLDWWTDGQCATLPPGTYQLATLWRLYPRDGVTKRLLVDSNIFEVTQ